VAIVDTIAADLSSLYDHIVAWFEELGAEEQADTLDVGRLQAEADVLTQKFLVHDTFLDEFIEAGWSQARYSALAGDAVGTVGLSLLTWSALGIDPDAGTWSCPGLTDT
jgi:hypothetical protein